MSDDIPTVADVRSLMPNRDDISSTTAYTALIKGIVESMRESARRAEVEYVFTAPLFYADMRWDRKAVNIQIALDFTKAGYTCTPDGQFGTRISWRESSCM